MAKRLRYVTAPVLLVANKADTPALDAQADEFYRFGRKIVRVSAKENRGKAELLDAICERLPEPSPDDAAARRAGDEGGDRGPAERGQEHAGQHAGRRPSG